MDYYWLTLGLFLGIGLFFSVGWRRGPAEVMKEETWLLADRNLGFFSLTATLVMTELNTSTLTAFASLGYSCGLWALSIPFIFLFGLLFYAFTVAKKWRSVASLSVAELFTRCYGPIIGRTASVCLIIASLGFTATYVRSITLIFSPLAPSLSPSVLSLLLVALTLLITMPRGLVSIVETNVATFYVILAFVALALFSITWPQYGPSIAEGMKVMPPSKLSALIVLTMLTYISAPWYGQKILAARSKTVAFSAAISAALLVFAIYLVAILSGTQLQGATLDNPDLSLGNLICRLPLFMRGPSYAMLFAITATTLSGVWSAIVSMIVADFLGGNFSKDRHRSTRLAWLMAGISFVLANTLIDEIFAKLILANIPAFALSFALLAAFYWPKVSRTGAATSISVGLAWGVFTYLYFGEAGNYTLYWIFGGLPLIFGSGVVASLVWPRVSLETRTRSL